VKDRDAMLRVCYEGDGKERGIENVIPSF